MMVDLINRDIKVLSLKARSQIVLALKSHARPEKFCARKTLVVIMCLGEFNLVLDMSKSSMSNQTYHPGKVLFPDPVGYPLFGCGYGFKMLFIFIFDPEINCFNDIHKIPGRYLEVSLELCMSVFNS